jgi:prepilin peptidase CpaA
VIHGVVVLVWLGLCALQDGRQRRIANRLTLGAALSALIYLACTGTTWLGGAAVEGGWALAVALALSLPGYALGRFGAGDVKLLAALGLAGTVDCLLWSLIVAVVAQGGWVLAGQRLAVRLSKTGLRASKKQPFAPCVLVGFTLYWLWVQ